MKKITTLLCVLLCAVMLMAPLSNLAHAVGTGTASDPYILTSMPYETTINVTPNANGGYDSYFYKYTATRACRLNTQVEGSAALLVEQNGEQVYGTVDMMAGDVIIIELFPMLEGTVVMKLWEEDFPLGSRYNPITLSFNDLKAGYTFDLTQQDERWYQVTAPETGVLDFSTTNMGWGFFLGFNGNSTDDGCAVLGDFGSNPVKKGSRPINAGETFLLCAEYIAAEPGTFTVKVEYVPPFTINTATQQTMFDGLYAVTGSDEKAIFGVEFDYDAQIVSALDIKNNEFLGSYNFHYNLDNGALELTNKRGEKAPYTISVIEDATKPEGAYLKLTYNGQYVLNRLETTPTVSSEAIDLMTGRFEDIFLGEVYETFIFDYAAGTVTVAPDWQSEGIVYHIESYSAFSGMLVLKADDGDIITMIAAGGQIIYNDNALTEVHEHKYTGKTTHATCLEGGSTVFTCDCGDSYTGDYTDALGHDWKAATCDSPKMCTRCRTTEGEALGHAWVEATCEAPKTCSTCGATEGAALGHAWAEATCEAPKTCSTCGATEGAALGHAWVNATCDTAKTCATCGATEGAALGHTWVNATCDTAKTCSACGATEGAALGHSYGAWTADGDMHKKVCANCGDAVKEAHAWDDGVVTKEPTEDQDGEKKLTCTVCAGTKTQIIPSLAHTHSYTAVITDPTCTAAGFTTYTCGCGETYTEQGAAALGHNYKNVVTAPTCTEGGYTTATCSVCGDVKVENHTNAIGHQYDAVVTEPSCTEGGYTTHTCSACGDVKVDGQTAPVAHTYDAGVANGDKVIYTCTVCGYSYEGENTNKPGDVVVPGALTGTVDGTKEFLWTATEDGFLQIDNVSTMTGANHTVTINGEPALATEEGYAVVAGDQVVITITTFSPIEINIPIAMANSHVGGGESSMEFDVTWPAGSWNGYSGEWYAPADGVYSFIIDASNIPADGLTFRVIVNDTWYNQYEFPLTADGKQYISVSLFAGDSVMIMAYDDAHTAAGQLHIVVIEGEPALHEHAYDAGVVTTAPTCNAEGVMTYTCDCGETKTEKMEKLAHAYGDWEVVKEATTTEEGSRKRVCSACGAEEVESIPMIETQPTEPTEPTEPTVPTAPTAPTDPTEPEETDPADPTEPATVPATTGGNNAEEGGDATLIIVIAVVAVIAGAIVAVVLLKKKK